MYSDAIIAAMVIGMPSLVVTVWMILRHREKMVRQNPLVNEPLTGIEARLARLEDAVDGIALEMERLGEGQRFTAKLLAERGSRREEAPVAPRPPERISTPH